MSAATPDHVVQAIALTALHGYRGYVTTRKQAQDYILDLGGWFSWRGKIVDIYTVPAGAGLIEMKGKYRYE